MSIVNRKIDHILHLLFPMTNSIKKSIQTNKWFLKYYWYPFDKCSFFSFRPKENFTNADLEVFTFLAFCVRCPNKVASIYFYKRRIFKKLCNNNYNKNYFALCSCHYSTT